MGWSQRPLRTSALSALARRELAPRATAPAASPSTARSSQMRTSSSSTRALEPSPRQTLCLRKRHRWHGRCQKDRGSRLRQWSHLQASCDRRLWSDLISKKAITIGSCRSARAYTLGCTHTLVESPYLAHAEHHRLVRDVFLLGKRDSVLNVTICHN